MFLTDRERHILSILLDAPSGVKVRELTDLLDVSRRTVYRELSTLEETLAHSNVSIINQRGIGYQLEGEQDNIHSLRLQVEDKHPSEMSIPERQRAVSLRLLLSQELTMEALADELMVSQSTIQSDLADVEEELERFDVYIDRIKFQGITVLATERKRREIASRLIYGSVEDYDFFKYLNSLKEDRDSKFNDYFLSILSPDSLYYANESINHDSSHQFSKVTDNQLQHVIIMIAMTIDRIQAGHLINEPIPAKAISQEIIYLAHEILGYISSKIALAIDLDERHFIALQLEGLNYKTSQSIFFETFDSQLTYQVKELIRVVTEHTGNDFRYDDSLFYDLVAHIQATLKRPVLLDYKLDTPVLKRINEEYPNLAVALDMAWDEVFDGHMLTNDEKAYIVIHFATSLERHPSIQREVNAIVVSSSGVGTGKILESRLKRYLPEINSVTVIQLSRLQHVDFSNYQLILSTIYLSGMERDYRVISPLLTDKEIEGIRKDIQAISRQSESKYMQVAVQTDVEFNQLYDYLQDAKLILDQISVLHIESQETVELTLELIINSLDKNIILDANRVCREVNERYLKAPIGIPKSSVALFHSSNQWVKQPYFSIYELDQPFALIGMDGQEIQLKRMLLMIAPEKMSAYQQQLLGLISSSIIESDINTVIYEQGTEEEVYQLISSLFVREVQHLH
ncbi:BglG family transcription antiterminator [Ruoffia tabacinasalis]|uniref:BglG family transcription antiterminator n=1 Tax=Ruoffia tabacinasalis TaxID=87458 RepID=A0ABS0LHT3_9LACT|nr:HTH domain-containing protein [Ruoffia tabacinasalis]MBG9977689.1 BglG family transcription antiterminator [Ruoffia tabacinasalis]